MPKKTFEVAAEAQAHLIVQLKDNQPTLCRNVEAVCKNTKPLSGVQTVDRKKRNRHETRTVAVFDARPAVAGTEWQAYVAAIVAVERRVLNFQPATGLWKPSRETAFYLSNRSVRAGQAAEAIRKHWGIENKLHYTRDVTLCEDASRIRQARRRPLAATPDRAPRAAAPRVRAASCQRDEAVQPRKGARS